MSEFKFEKEPSGSHYTNLFLNKSLYLSFLLYFFFNNKSHHFSSYLDFFFFLRHYS